MCRLTVHTTSPLHCCMGLYVHPTPPLYPPTTPLAMVEPRRHVPALLRRLHARRALVILAQDGASSRSRSAAAAAAAAATPRGPGSASAAAANAAMDACGPVPPSIGVLGPAQAQELTGACARHVAGCVRVTPVRVVCALRFVVCCALPPLCVSCNYPQARLSNSKRLQTRRALSRELCIGLRANQWLCVLHCQHSSSPVCRARRSDHPLSLVRNVANAVATDRSSTAGFSPETLLGLPASSLAWYADALSTPLLWCIRFPRRLAAHCHHAAFATTVGDDRLLPVLCWCPL
jgi:hypothetical protein